MGKTIFPYISFFDGYVNYKIPPYNWEQAFDPEDLQINTKELSTMMNSGIYDWKWDGTNNYGDKTSSGVYILTLEAKSLESGTHFKNAIKLILAK